MRVIWAIAIMLVTSLFLPLLACGDSTPPPKPTAKPTQKPQATATAVPTATATLSPTPTATPSYSVRIYEVNYKGDPLTNEADEYVVIINTGTESVYMGEWVLKDITDGYPSFTFPHYYLEAKRMIRVYTKEYDEDWGGFRFNYDEGIWNNSHPDVAALYDKDGYLVSQATYEIK